MTLTPRNIRKRGPKVLKKLGQHPAWDRPLKGPGCYSDEEVGLVVQAFKYDGKGRKVTVRVKLHPKAMAALIRAMMSITSIQVTTSFESAYSGSYRNCAQQKWLYDRYISGEGHLAAQPGRSYHQTGRAVDLYLPSPMERRAMLDEGFMDLLPQDPPHFALGVRG